MPNPKRPTDPPATVTDLAAYKARAPRTPTPPRGCQCGKCVPLPYDIQNVLDDVNVLE